MANLNERQKLFCVEYIKDLNATQAAIRAGYSKKTAGAQSHKLLKNAEIQNSIRSASKSRTERTEIDADWVLLKQKNPSRLMPPLNSTMTATEK